MVDQSIISLDQKKPSTRAGVVALFAVTHQGPAQEEKAGTANCLGVIYQKKSDYFKNRDKEFSQR
jgi:hypothetical protein